MQPTHLIIDDLEHHRKIMRAFLEEKEILYDEAVDGLDGLNKALANTYDVIWVDVGLPKMNGVEFTKKLRETNNTVVIVGITGYRRETYPYYLSCGMNYMLQKPLNYSDFNKFMEHMDYLLGKK